MSKPELRPYQKEDSKVLASSGRHLVAHTMGLGKTAIVLDAIRQLNGTPTLIVATKNALGVWQEEIEKWLDLPSVIYSAPGKPKKRQLAWEQFMEYDIPFLITNYAYIEEIAKRKSYWSTLVADEIHLAGLLNHKSKTFQKFKNLLNSRYLFLVTGSPIRQTPADLYAPLHLLNPNKFRNYWPFVNKYCIRIKTPFGSEIERRPKDVKQFRQMLAPYMLRRTKDQVADELPKKIRSAIPIEMTNKQARLYTNLVEELMTDVEGDVIITPNALARDTALRQLLVSPQLIGAADEGAAIPTLLENVESEFAEGNSVAVFTPYRAAVSLIADRLRKYASFVGEIHGGMGHEKITSVARQFQSLKTHKKAIVCTIRSGTSFTIHAASAAYFIGYEWDFNHNEQAEDRLHRIGQTKMVRCYYIMHRDTIDDRVMEVVSGKKSAADLILKPEHLLPERYRKKSKIDR